MDNATGVSALLNLARMFALLPERPKRSLIFVAVGGEESGPLGSQYYVQHPDVPLDLIAANINIDGLNVWERTRDVIMIGLGRSTIDSVVMRVASRQQRIVKPDQFPEQGSFYRSDQFSFAQQKVADYIARHYHQPSDELHEDWDLSGAVEDVQLMFLVAHQLANAPEMPRWKKGDEFEAVRQPSLAK